MANSPSARWALRRDPSAASVIFKGHTKGPAHARSVLHSKSVLYGGFVWARGALNSQNRDFWPGQKKSSGQLLGVQSTHSGLHGKGEAAVLVSGDTQGAETNWEDVYVMLPRPGELKRGDVVQLSVLTNYEVCAAPPRIPPIGTTADAGRGAQSECCKYRVAVCRRPPPSLRLTIPYNSNTFRTVSPPFHDPPHKKVTAPLAMACTLEFDNAVLHSMQLG